MNKYYVSGLIGSGIPVFIVLVFLTFSLGIFLWVLALPTWLIGGLSAGYLGDRFSKDNSGFGLRVLTAFLGFVFGCVIGILGLFLFL